MNDLLQELGTSGPKARLVVMPISRVLVERELMAADKGSNDRRAVQLRLLPAGAKALKRCPGPFSGVLPSALGTLDDKTLKRLEKDLAKLIEALNADEAAGGIPLAEL